MSSHGGSGTPANSGLSDTHPTGSTSLARNASKPTTAVVATEPRAPTSHNPVPDMHVLLRVIPVG
jgi:hypothetical protein